MVRKCDRASEAVLLAMACLSPWAFGAMRAWAEAGLYLGVSLVAVLGAVSGPGLDRPRRRAGVPGLALAGLAVLALAQAAAWPGGLAAKAAPSSSAFKAAIAPGGPERVLGDPGPPVGAPGPALSQCPEMTADAAVRLAAGWVLFQAVLGPCGGPAVLRRLGLALAANAALVALFSVVQMLSWNGRMYWVTDVVSMANGGPFYSKNHLAAYLNLGLGFALAALFAPEQGGRGRRFAAAYAAGLIGVGVLVSLSRAGFVSMLVAAAVYFAAGRPRLGRAAGAAAVVLGLGAVFLWSVGAAGPYRRIATVLESGSYVDRVAIWRVALRAWSSYPVTGLGLGTFTASGRFFEVDDGCFVGHAESEYMEALAEGGLVGLGLALVLLGSVAALGLRGLAAADNRGRVPVLGALFAVAALATQCLSDFPLHSPAIAVVAVMLAAHLTRAGLDARGSAAAPRAGPVGAAAAWFPVALALLALWHGLVRARAEAALAGGDVPPAGYAMPTASLWDAPMPRLERARGQLVDALRDRPDWAEGHVRLGIVLLSQYRSAVADEVGGQVGDPGRAAAMADPLWLHRVVHTATAEQIAGAGGVLASEPVRRYLVPAARCFLEARRCCPVWGLPHAELASLDYLIAGGESASTHARRALRLAGHDSPTVALAALASAQAGDLKLAAGCWRKMLRVRDLNWPAVAAACGSALTPEQVLEWVVPDGRYAVLFADRLYGAPGDRRVHDRFLRWAAARLPADRGLPEAERLRYEAQALAGLGRAGTAEARMTAALEREPRRADWRKLLVEWLIGWGKLDEANDQALLGLYFAPDDPDSRKAAELAAEALARGPRDADTPGPE